MKINLPVTNTEHVLKETDTIVSKTDLKGIITYINEDFLRISGFAGDELIGASHNIVRHPDMPPEAFEDLWNSMKAGRPWTGLVKNRCKNGDFYWVLANATPFWENGQLVGCMSVRTKPSRAQIEAADGAYRLFREGRAGNLKIQDGKVVKSTLWSKLNMFKNISIKSRLTFVVSMLSLLLVVIGSMGLIGMSKANEGLRTVYEDRTVALGQIDQIESLILDNRLQTSLALLNPTAAEIKRQTGIVEKHIEQIGETWKAYMATYLTPEEKAIADKFAEDRARFVKEGLHPLIALLRAGKFKEATVFNEEKLDQLFAPVREGIDKLGNLQLDVAKQEYAEAQSRYSTLRNSAIGMVAAGVILALWLGIALIRAIVRPLNATIGHFNQIAQGNFNNVIEVERQDEIGRVMEALKAMQTKLGFDLSESKRVAAEALRIQNALDNVSTNVMIADNERNLIYMNKSIMPMFAAAQNDIRKDMPSFDANRLMGSSIDQFHKNPAHQKQMLASFTSTFKTEIKLGGRTFALAASPVINDRGERLGSVVEWQDRTIEVAAEKELAEIVNGAVQGDFSVRMDMHGKSGFLQQLGEGMNKLMQTSETALNELAQMLRALSQGNLNEKITNDYYGTFGQLKDDANATAGQLREIILNEVGRVLEALSRGDLTEKISNDYPGAFGQLKDDANTTVEKLTEIIAQVKDSTDLITTASQEIAQGNSDLSQRTEEQASSLEETASSMEELLSTVRRNTESAKHASQLAQGTSEVAEQSGKDVDILVTTMAAINESSRKIEDIISVIDGIAFQTNILALNAAVEAARAGEQGRGFAVVAGEVRNLAQRSAAAAKEIKLLIGDSVEKVSVGSRQVKEASDSISDVVTSVQLVASLMKEISVATAEQSMSIEQVNTAITQMDDVTQQNAALVEEAAAAAESMQDQANNLTEAMGTFKLEAGRDNVRGRAKVAAQPARISANKPAIGFHGSIATALPASSTRAGDLGDIRNKITQARRAAMVMIANKDKRDAYWQNLAKDSADAVSDLLDRIMVPHGKEARVKELKEIWAAFKKTREEKLIPLLLAGKQREAEEVAGGAQVERLNKIMELCDELDG
jgi:methyl-accepting chemotaxis protein